VPSVSPHNRPLRLGFGATFAILWAYFRDNLREQLRSIWFIITYLILFQITVLAQPLAYAGMIACGVALAVVGLMFFMEGLRLGLMPLAETLGVVLPRNTPLLGILLFAFLLGAGATLAEPAIAALQQAGSTIVAADAPLLYSLLVDFPEQLVAAVGVGVGAAVAVGILRFFRGWSLKRVVLPLVAALLALTLAAINQPLLAPLLGLAWDCGAITTGPVTVPLVLALGIGVCRIVSDGETAHAGFGIVTLASLLPVLAVLALGVTHWLADDYYGRAGYDGVTQVRAPEAPSPPSYTTRPPAARFAEEDFNRFLATGRVEHEFRVSYAGGQRALEDGRIVLRGSDIVLERVPAARARVVGAQNWDPDTDGWRGARDALFNAARAIVPLCLFLLLTLRMVLGERLRNQHEILIGLTFALFGMTLFVLGLTLGLNPLGAQIGGNLSTLIGVPGASVREALFGQHGANHTAAIAFGFFLGYGATLAEPALIALGQTVEKITVGAFRRRLLMHSVAFGVGIGVAGGIYMLVHRVPLALLLIPPYAVVLLLTWLSSEEFVNIGWDSAGVTTGPVTVPLVLATGLGLGAEIPGVADGFGILALASLGPIVSVLAVGFIVSRTGEGRRS